jgi:hypothetical protein
MIVSQSKKITFIALFIFLITSGIYWIPGIPISQDLFRILRIIAISVLFFSILLQINYKKIKKSILVYCIFAWCLIIFCNIVFRANVVNIDRYIYFIFQLLSSVLLAYFFGQNQNNLKKFVTQQNIKILIFLILLVWALIYGAIHLNYFSTLLSNGFSDNLSNYSIWLSNIGVFALLAFYFARPKSRLQKIMLFFLLVGLFILIFNSGGRLGALILSLAGLYIMSKIYHSFFAATISIITVISASFLFTHNFKFLNHESSAGRDILRHITVLNNTNSPNIVAIDTNLYEYLDTLSSHRLSIIKNSINKVDLDTAIYGKGIENFFVTDSLGINTYQIHDLFLNTLIEQGLFVFLLLLLITLFPLFINNKSEEAKICKFVCIIWTFAAALQPQLLITQVHLSVVYWLAYGFLALKENNSGYFKCFI